MGSVTKIDSDLPGGLFIRSKQPNAGSTTSFFDIVLVLARLKWIDFCGMIRGRCKIDLTCGGSEDLREKSREGLDCLKIRQQPHNSAK